MWKEFNVQRSTRPTTSTFIGAADSIWSEMIDRFWGLALFGRTHHTALLVKNIPIIEFQRFICCGHGLGWFVWIPLISAHLVGNLSEVVDSTSCYKLYGRASSRAFNFHFHTKTGMRLKMSTKYSVFWTKLTTSLSRMLRANLDCEFDSIIFKFYTIQ